MFYYGFCFNFDLDVEYVGMQIGGLVYCIGMGGGVVLSMVSFFYVNVLDFYFCKIFLYNLLVFECCYG